MSARTLTRRQKTFCAEYVLDRNGRQAAIRSGYSERSAATYAHELLKRDDIQEVISAEEDRRLKLNKDRFVWELIRLAYSDIRNVVPLLTGELKLEDLKQLPPDITASIQSIYVKPNGEIKITMHNKAAPMRLLVKYCPEVFVGGVDGSGKKTEESEMSPEVLEHLSRLTFGEVA